MLAKRHLAACDLLPFACLHGRGSALLTLVQNHLLAVHNHFRWFRTKRARLHKLARRPTSPRKRHLPACDLVPYICLHGRFCTAGGGSKPFASGSEPFPLVQNQVARLHRLARRHLAARDLQPVACLHGRGSALLAAVQNHFRWFTTKRARLHKLARRHSAACDLRSYVCLHGRGFALLAAVQNHLLAVRNHFHCFGTKRARLHKLARRHLAACDLLPFAC